MASAAEAESLLSELLRRGGDGVRGALGLLHPILMGLMGAADGETEAPQPVRIVLMNPMTGRVVVLHSDASIISEFLVQVGGRRGPPPASKASIEALRNLDPAEREPGHECPVCLVEIVGGVESEQEAVREMPCKHMFHEGCINKWLGMHGSCPVCRFQMPVEEEVAATKSEETPLGEEGEEEEHQLPRMIMNISISIPAAAGPQQPPDDDDDGEHQQEQERRMENID